MLRVALKSLLDRKLRLLLSTFAIVLGVGFVAGSLVFTDMLQSRLHTIFAARSATSSCATRRASASSAQPTDKTVPASLIGELRGSPGRGPGRRQRHATRHLRDR